MICRSADSVVHDTISCSLASVSRCVKSLLCPCRFYRFLTAVPTVDVLPTASSTQHIPDALTFCLLLAAAPDVLLTTTARLSFSDISLTTNNSLLSPWRNLASLPFAHARLFLSYRDGQAHTELLIIKKDSSPGKSLDVPYKNSLLSHSVTGTPKAAITRAGSMLATLIFLSSRTLIPIAIIIRPPTAVTSTRIASSMLWLTTL